MFQRGHLAEARKCNQECPDHWGRESIKQWWGAVHGPSPSIDQLPYAGSLQPGQIHLEPAELVLVLLPLIQTHRTREHSGQVLILLLVFPQRLDAEVTLGFLLSWEHRQAPQESCQWSSLAQHQSLLTTGNISPLLLDLFFCPHYLVTQGSQVPSWSTHHWTYLRSWVTARYFCLSKYFWFVSLIIILWKDYTMAQWTHDWFSLLTYVLQLWHL